MRVVLVLGREPDLDEAGVDAAADEAASSSLELVLLSLGYPVADEQQRILNRALDLAGERGDIALCEKLVFNCDQLSTYLEAGDRITISSRSGREKKKIEAALAPSADG